MNPIPWFMHDLKTFVRSFVSFVPLWLTLTSSAKKHGRGHA
jgi:hypothetical protein